jgi:hypothetical protein
MKIFSCWLLLLVVPAIGRAQTPVFKNEAGVITEVEKNAGSYGLQYERWAQPWLGLHLKATYGIQHDDHRGNIPPLYFNDTILLRSLSRNYQILHLGVGIDVQKRFYKSAFLYASLSLNGGYGKGQSDTSGTLYYNGQEFPAFRFQDKSETLKKFYLELVPSVGVKFNLKRFVIGTDVSIIRNAMTIESKEGHSNTLFDFELGHFSQRLYIHYRF